MKEINLFVIGLLGGATKQAVSQAKNPLRWLKSRIRRELSPSPGFGPGNYSREELIGYATEKFRGHKLTPTATQRLDHFAAPLTPDLHRRGRPRTLVTPTSLAAFLEIEPQKTLTDTFEAFRQQQLETLIKLLGNAESFTRQELDQLLDVSWLPYHPREGCAPPPGYLP